MMLQTILDLNCWEDKCIFVKAAGIAIRSMCARLQVKDVVGVLSRKPESMPLICHTFFQHGALDPTSQGLD